MAKQLTAPGCKYSIVARVDTTIYSPDQKWVLDVPAGQSDFIAETNEIIIPADAMMCPKAHQIDEDTARVTLLGRGVGSLATFITRAIEQIVGKGNVRVEYGDGKLAVSLDSSVTSAQITEVENLLERLLPKDVELELDEIPPGYMRAEFLESTGTQYIDTGYAFDNNTGIACTFIYTNAARNMNVIAGRSDGLSDRLYSPFFGLENSWTVGYSQYIATGIQNPDPFRTICSTSNNFKNDKKLLVQDTELYSLDTDANFSCPYTLVIFGARVSDRVVNPLIGRVFEAQISQGSEIVRKYIPTITPTGVPCMYDRVTGESFANAGSGKFIIGMTAAQAVQLANLPATGGNLTVSLPWEAQLDAGVQNALDAASTKGWIITVQYRDPAVATTNIPISFLESTGTQYIDTGLRYSTMDTYSETLDLSVTDKNHHSYTGVNYLGWCTVQDGNYHMLDVGHTPIGERDIIYNKFLNGYSFLYVNGSEVASFNLGEAADYVIAGVFSLGNRDNTWFNNTQNIKAKLYSAKFTQNDVLVRDMIPAITYTGTPCLYDAVSDQNFYNAGTGAFIAGFDTAEQAGKLATLPDVTAETDETKKSLTVSFPLELAFDAGVQRALSIATARGWTIAVQYRESELTTEHIEADFLESATGGHDIKVEVPVIDEHTGVYAKWSQPVINDRMPISRAYDDYRLYPPKWMFIDGVLIGGSGGIDARKVSIPAGFVANKVYTGSMNLFDDGAHCLDGVTIAVINNPVGQSSFRDIHIFGYYLDDRNYSAFYGFIGRIYEAKITQDSMLINHFIPAIDSTGIPCMHDTVTDQNFHTQGSGSFTVGFDTTEKAAVSLSKLPFTTGGTLTVSLPAEAKNTDTLVPAAIDIAKSRGWTIITQYRTN